MVKISAVIITFNEERNIGRCLASLKGVVDEVVVVDSYSTDKTEKICSKYNVKFIQHAFKGHIEQKNYAITKAKYRHVLSLDADEALSDELRDSILKVKKNWKHDGYYFNRLTNYCGKWIRHTSWYPARKLRLWDSKKGTWGGINPHDRFIMKKGTSTRFLKGDLYHYSYYSIQQHILQINSFSDIVAKAYFDKGKRGTYLNIIFNPLWRLFRDFIIKGGIFDGFYGLVICVNSAHETFLKYVKLRQLAKNEVQEQKNVICFFNTARSWGGGEKWNFDMAKLLHEKGYKVMVMTSKNSELAHRVALTSIPVLYTTVSNLSFLNILKLLHFSGVFKARKVKTLFVNLSADFKMAGIAAKMAGVNNIVYRRGSAIPIRNTGLNRFLYQKVATRIIANSRETSRTIFQNNDELVPSSKVRIIYNGIDLADQDTKGKSLDGFKNDNTSILIGNAGRLSREKGHVYLLETARLLKERGLNFRLLLAGTGKLEPKLKKLVEQMDLSEQVDFVGFVEDIRVFHELIDVFVLTSLWEGFGYVLVEAMSKKKPVVAFDIKSSSEIVVHNKTGFLVKKFDIHDLADKLEILIRDKKLREKFGKEGLKRVEKKFTINHALKAVEKLLKQM